MEYRSNPWLPSSDESAGDWERGHGAKLIAALMLDAGSWFLLTAVVTAGAPRWLVLVAAVLTVMACISLAVGAATKLSLAMRLVGWPAAGNPPRAEFGAAWIELFVLFIILLFSRVFTYWGHEWTQQVAAVACVDGGLSAILMVTTGRSLGRRLLRVLRR
jgi:hypothetical protein